MRYNYIELFVIITCFEAEIYIWRTGHWKCFLNLIFAKVAIRTKIISGCTITGEVNTNDKELVLYPDDWHDSNENAISTFGCAGRIFVHYKNAFCAAFTDYDFLWSGKVLVARAVNNVYEINQLKSLCLMTLTLMSGGRPSPRTDQGGHPGQQGRTFLLCL